eukprot:TRINITY_DN44362_c0_g1_i1.p1 TRINITY_DN44362_c0_g1~~TRINITY_DN44362_c0_g1_i1.p1  ORF type:complete len:357 (-),score=28.19 TRINITY_DN44362_c0_g1_i1:131-1132(-)
MPIVFGSQGFEYEPLRREGVVPLLEGYGYQPLDDHRWRTLSTPTSPIGNGVGKPCGDYSETVVGTAAMTAVPHEDHLHATHPIDSTSPSPRAACAIVAQCADLTQATTARRLQRPRIDAQVLRHVEMGDHTWYVLACFLRPAEESTSFEVNGSIVDATIEPPTEDATWLKSQAQSLDAVFLQWKAKRRLSHLRTHLYDVVRLEFGETAYAQHFANAPFALRGGVPGTSKRLNSWLAALCACINCGAAPPRIVSMFLLFLEPPLGGAEPEVDEESDYAEFSRASAAARETIDLNRSNSGTLQDSSRSTSTSSVISNDTTVTRWWWMPLPGVGKP